MSSAIPPVPTWAELPEAIQAVAQSIALLADATGKQNDSAIEIYLPDGMFANIMAGWRYMINVPLNGPYGLQIEFNKLTGENTPVEMMFIDYSGQRVALVKLYSAPIKPTRPERGYRK